MKKELQSIDLRIGNLVYNREGNKVWVNPNHLIIMVYGINDLFKPIPLTEEWLLKFGFEIDEIWNDGEVSEVSYKLKVNCYEELYINIGLGIWQLGSDVHMCYTHNRDIQYVHQLQNLYFALTGEELELKSDNP